MGKFHYKVGSVETTTPWLRPTYDRLKNYLIDIRENTDILDKFDLYIYGKCLFDWHTWDVDLYLYGHYENIEELESTMNVLYEKALNQHKLLVDISWKPKHIEVITHEMYSVQGGIEREKTDMIKFNSKKKNDTRTPDSIRHPSFSFKYTELDSDFWKRNEVEAVGTNLVKICFHAGREFHPKIRQSNQNHKLFQGAPINANIFIDTDIDWWCANRDKIIG